VRVFSANVAKRVKPFINRGMTRLVAIAFFIIVAAPLASAKSKRCTFRVHAQGNENDSSVFASPVTTPIAGKNIFIEKIPVISENDVSAFRPYTANNGSFGALLQLDDHGRLALDTVSIEHRGGTLLVFVNGRAITELFIDRRVSDGRIFIASGLTAGDVASMQKTWPQMDAKKRK
jgi:hypothetical protein